MKHTDRSMISDDTGKQQVSKIVLYQVLIQHYRMLLMQTDKDKILKRQKSLHKTL